MQAQLIFSYFVPVVCVRWAKAEKIRLNPKESTPNLIISEVHGTFLDGETLYKSSLSLAHRLSGGNITSIVVYDDSFKCKPSMINL